MKLKKIASLMLAGVMAVSMLTACNTTSNTPDTGDDDQGTTTPVTGYSAKLAEEMADKSTLAGVKIDWNEDSDLQSYLNYEVGNVGYNALTENFLRSLSGGNVQYVDTNWATPRVVTTVLTEMEDDLSVGSASSNINGLYQAITGLNPDPNNYDSDDYNTVLLFVVDNGASLDNAMDQISGQMYRAVEELDDDYATAGAVSSMNVDYEYTGSVATSTKTFESGHGVGVSFIAVEIVRHIA